MEAIELDYRELLQEALIKGKKAIDRPKVYFSTASDPEYPKEQARYVAAHMFPHGPKAPPQKTPLRFYLAQIQQGWSKESGLAPFNEDFDKYVAEGIKLFNDTAMGDGSWPFRLKQEANELGGALCRVIGWLLQQANHGNKKQRQIAKRRLKRIIAIDSRGKRATIYTPPQVKVFYYHTLFGLYQIQHTLRTDGGSPGQRVKAASQNFGMPVNEIRDLWNLNDHDQPKARHISIKEMARIQTAEYFKVTQHRVSNILAT